MFPIFGLSTEKTIKICLDTVRTQNSRSISMVGYGKFFEKGFISESKFLKDSTPTGQKILPEVPL